MKPQLSHQEDIYMRTRQEIKAIGKDRFKANYWPCVLAVLLVMLVIGVISGVFTLPGTISAVNSGDPEEAGGGLSSIGNLIILIISGPLEIGLCYFFVMNVLGREGITATTPFTAAFTNFGRKLGGYLWMGLFTFLWSLLFFIPGIIKAFSYAMTPYILADCPNVPAKDALKLSMRIMKGHKWQLFVFELSFLGWELLSALTAGLLDLFYVQPYMQSALATYYLEVREEALRTGAITMGQLEGVEAV